DIKKGIRLTDQMIKSPDMCCCQIINMDVVTNAGSVGCVIITAEYFQTVSLSGSGRESKRDKMCFRIMSFSGTAFWVCAGRIEITKCNGAETIYCAKICEHGFDHRL